jgi:CRISPR-associated Csx14 family protein
MAALMAWVAPFFSCVKKLYHVIDNHESDKGNDHFLSAYRLDGRSSALHMHLMHPNPDDLSLVTIPFERGQQISRKLIAQLNMLEPDDEKADYEKDEALITGQTAFQEETVLKVSVTDLVIKQFSELFEKDVAHIVRNGLLSMSKKATLQQHKTDSDTYRFKAAKMDPANLHYFTGLPISIQPVFYTRPGDIYSETDEPIEQVVICSLERKGTNGYRALKDMKKDSNFSLAYTASVDALPPLPSPAESILIVPLGKSPMVATQLYTLLTEQKKHTIHEVVLIYPEEEEIVNGARLIQRAFADKHIPYKPVCIKGLKDIKSKENCETYQLHLESEIDKAQEKYPEYKIDLALSGGRKGMTAMTIFAAQKKRIPYVYHTLITNDDINEQIEEETTFAKLNETSLSRQTMYDRLFLEAYKVEGPNPYKHFTLFRVPVFRPDGW